MNNWKIIPTIVFATVLIFGAGVFTGGILVTCVKPQSKPPVKHVQVTPTNSVVATSATNGAPFKPIKPPEILNKEFLQRLDADLHLSKAQHDSVQKIIEEGQNLIRKTLQDARLEIREVLTPEQRTDFDELVKRPFHKPIFSTNAPPAAVTTNVMTTNAAPATKP
ncbi:MAG TPA: hypothetical protein VF988_14055 [Verrucomicrobiae bacterium]